MQRIETISPQSTSLPTEQPTNTTPTPPTHLNSGSFQKHPLNPVPWQNLPRELWFAIFGFSPTKRELAPHRLVSRAWQTAIDKMEVDYSCLIRKKINSRFMDSNCANDPFITLVSRFIPTTSGRRFYLNELKNDRPEHSQSANCLPEREILVRDDFLISALLHFKKNIIVSASRDKQLRLWDIQKRECVGVFNADFTSNDNHLRLIKLGDSFITCQSLSSQIWPIEIAIWNTREMKCASRIKIDFGHLEKTGWVKCMFSLPDEKSLLIATTDAIYQWDSTTGQIQRRPLLKLRTVHLFSHDQLVVHFEEYFQIIKISTLFEEHQWESEKIVLDDPQCNLRSWLSSNGHIVCTRQIYQSEKKQPTWSTTLEIYNTDQKRWVIHALNETLSIQNLFLQEDGQHIAIHYHYDELFIYPFDLKNGTL